MRIFGMTEVTDAKDRFLILAKQKENDSLTPDTAVEIGLHKLDPQTGKPERAPSASVRIANDLYVSEDWSTSGRPEHILENPNGYFIYLSLRVIGTGENELLVIKISADLTSMEVIQTIPNTWSEYQDFGILGTSRSGKFLYAYSRYPSSTKDIVVFEIDPQSGILTPVQ
jgi:hypothetical protein